MTDATNALLPCPFCGEQLSSVSVSEGSTFRWRKVDGCCTDGPEVRHDTMADDQVAAEAQSRADAIAAWNRRQPTASAGMVVVPEDAPQVFVDYFVKNYPGPDTIIGNPWWHVPKIWRAARHAMLAAHESQSPNRQVREDSQGLGEPGRLPPIDTDVEYDRHYIPLPGGWEIQTKGKGSSFRLCDTKSGRRMVMTGHHFEHEELERMAREIHAAVNMSPPADTTPDVSEPTDNVEGE